MSFFILSIVFILVPFSSAFAWGPGVHSLISLSILDSLNKISSQVASVIQAFPYEFLWGCISADIVIAKRFSNWDIHPHNWNVILNIFNQVKSDLQLSFLYGYIAHLSSDVVAHNFFIPETIIRNFHWRGALHIKLEAQAEREVPHSVWSKMKDAIAGCKREECDLLLEKNLRGTIIPSVKLNKLIYLRMLKIEMSKNLFIKERNSNVNNNNINFDWYFDFSKRIAFDVLSRLEDSEFIKIDPTGTRPIEVSTVIRKVMLSLSKKNKILTDDIKKFLRILREFQPNIVFND